MIVTKKALARRTVLRGMGAAIALPLLDAMVPALTAFAKTPAKPVSRFGVVYVANGVAPGYWTPRDAATGWEMSPILEPLTPFKDRVVVLTGLDNEPGVAQAGEPTGGHGRTCTAFLTGAHCRPTEGGDVYAGGQSLDQFVATTLGQETQLPSLELQLDMIDLASSCDRGFSCTYENTLCWRTPTTPVPMENNPRAVFERLFGDSGSTDPAVRRARMLRDRSVLDAVRERAARLQGGLGAGDRVKVDEYLESIRAAERRIQMSEADGLRELPAMAQPAGIPVSWEEHAKLMFDLQVLAYQSDLTRVITFMMARDHSARVYPEAGVAEPHHGLSHHMGNAENKAKLAKVNAYHVRMFGYYLNKLQSTPDGEGTLLDHVLLLYGSAMGDPNIHDPHKLPIVLAGGARGQLKGGRHLTYAEGTPLSNLHVSLARILGVPVNQFGASTGELTSVS